jgi:predicted nucleic acid-binding protein
LTLSVPTWLVGAVMQRHEITEVATFDRGFDRVPGVTRHS